MRTCSCEYGCFSDDDDDDIVARGARGRVMNRGRAVVAPSYPVRPTFTAVLTAYLPVVSVFWAGGRPCSSERFRPENFDAARSFTYGTAMCTVR